jgi:hypothetical protein
MGESWGQAKIPRVGILSYGGTTDEAVKQWTEPFRRMLADQGWIEGKNVSFEYRRAVGDPALLAEAAADLTRLKVDVIFADSAPSVRTAHAATSTIPIVALDFTTDRSPKVMSRATAGRENITGVFSMHLFSGKWIELLKDIVPTFHVPWSCGSQSRPRTLAGSQGLPIVRSSVPGDRGQQAGGHRPGLLCVARTASGSNHPTFANDVLTERTTRQAST